MNEYPRIADAEWEVMKVVWNAETPVTSQQIIEALADRSSWRPKTVRTLINRLTRKGVLGYTKEGRGYLYHPRLKKEECAREAAQSFLNRVFGGSLRPMLAQFVEEKRLSRKEIAELKRLLDGKD
jgi:BlaI family penicillinase repressor